MKYGKPLLLLTLLVFLTAGAEAAEACRAGFHWHTIPLSIAYGVASAFILIFGLLCLAGALLIFALCLPVLLIELPMAEMNLTLKFTSTAIELVNTGFDMFVLPARLFHSIGGC